MAIASQPIGSGIPVALPTTEARMLLRDAIGLYAAPLTLPAVLALDVEMTRCGWAPQPGTVSWRDLAPDEAARLRAIMDAAIDRAARAAEAEILRELAAAARDFEAGRRA